MVPETGDYILKCNCGSEFQITLRCCALVTYLVLHTLLEVQYE